MIVLDTSALIDALCGKRRSAAALEAALTRGERIALTTLVLYEWLRGQRAPAELEVQEAIAPSAQAIPFGPQEAALAAGLYRQVRNARKREVDLAIAACAIVRGATLWTLNVKDFRDIPDLIVAEPG